MDYYMRWRHVLPCYVRILCLRHNTTCARCHVFWVAPFCEHGLRATLLCRKQTRSSRISSQHLPIHFRGVIWKIKSKSNSPVSFSLLSAQCRNESCRLLSNAERPSDRQPWGVAVNSSFAHKAHQRLGFVHRNLRGAPYKYRETAYQCLVRSQLEYCATVWDPTLKKDINSLEQVQRKAARWACGECGVASVTGLLKKLGWSELADRRWHQRLTLIYKTFTSWSLYHQTRSVYHEPADQHVARETRTTYSVHEPVISILHSGTLFHSAPYQSGKTTIGAPHSSS